MDIILKDGETLETLFDDKLIIQNTALYRFTSDSILLSRFAKGKLHDEVADFCAGSGVVGFHFLCLNPHVNSLTLFELQPALADMAERTAAHNGFNAKVVQGKLQDAGSEFDDAFTLILCNPPYERGGFEKLTYEKAICRKEITITLSEIIAAAARKLKFGGRLDIINRADRVAELIYGLKSRGLEPKRMQFVAGKEGAKPYLIMIEAVKGGKEGIEVLPTIIN